PIFRHPRVIAGQQEPAIPEACLQAVRHRGACFQPIPRLEEAAWERREARRLSGWDAEVDTGETLGHVPLARSGHVGEVRREIALAAALVLGPRWLEVALDADGLAVEGMWLRRI